MHYFRQVGSAFSSTLARVRISISYTYERSISWKDVRFRRVMHTLPEKQAKWNEFVDKDSRYPLEFHLNVYGVAP